MTGDSPRRPDPDRLASAGRQPDPQPGRGGHGGLIDRDRQRIVQPVGLGTIRIDLGDVALARGEESERQVKRTPLLIGDRAHEPGWPTALAPRYRERVSNLDGEHPGGLTFERDIAT